MIGRKFNRLTVVAYAPDYVSRGHHWTNCVCRCDCGATHIVRACSLKSGAVKSCGCLNREKAGTNLRKHGDFDETVRRAHVVCDMWEHYEHAREKHPYFCDWLRPVHNSTEPSVMLNMIRGMIDKDGERGMLCWETLVACENWEVIDAIVHGNYDSAVEECYDAIAVLLRVIDVLEGRQKLGRPEEGAAE